MTINVLLGPDVDAWSQFWFILVILIARSIVSIVCILMLWRSWPWALWICAVSALGITATAVPIGHEPAILIGWNVVLPWIVLLVAGFLRTRFAVPWIQLPPGAVSIVRLDRSRSGSLLSDLGLAARGST